MYETCGRCYKRKPLTAFALGAYTCIQCVSLYNRMFLVIKGESDDRKTSGIQYH